MTALSHGCFRLAVAMALALAIDFAVAEPPALEARIDAAGKSAVIGNGVVELEISWKQGLRLAHLKNVATGVDWIPQPPGYDWGPGPEGMLPGLVWRRDDIWPDLAPPSHEFVLRYTPDADVASLRSAPAGGQPPAKPVTLTGATPVTLVPESSRATVEGDVARLDLTFAIENHPLEIGLHLEIRAGVPAVRRWTSVANAGKKPCLLHELSSTAVSLRPGPGDLELFWIEACTHPTVGSRSPTRWRQATRHMELLGPTTRRTLQSDATAARPHDGSNGAMAWLALRDPSLDQGLVAGWEWSGSFAAEVGDFEEGAGVFGLRLGFGDEGGYARTLAPGATFTTPRVFLGFFRGDADEAGRATRAVAERLYGLPWPDGRPPMFVGYDTWSNWQDLSAGPTNHLKPERLDAEIERCRALGVELFILDYDWFKRLGDFASDPDRFPDGVEAVSRKVKAAGMKFGLWMGFGQAHADSALVREHPEFVAIRKGQPVTGGWGMRSLCFASEPCREYVLEKLCGVVDRFGVDWLKTDFDLITTSDSPTHSPQATDSRIESVEGYYSILERLHERRPKLYLDNWTPPMGGADFGNFARHHSMLLCDDYHPTAVRSAAHGMTHLFPPTRTHGYIRGFSRADERASYTNRSAAFGGGLYLISDILQWDEATIAATKREIELFKRDRSLFLDGEIHNLFPGKQPDHYGWEGRFVWSPAQGRGMAQVFRNHDPRERVGVRLRGLPPDGRYVVEFVEAGTTLRADGRSLVREGVDVPLAKPFTTEVLLVRME